MNMELFNSKNQPIRLNMPDANVMYYPGFFDQTKSNVLFEILLKTIAWQQDDITIFGKTHPQPRLTALYADNGNTYSYSNITMNPILFTKDLLFIKEKVETVCKANFTTCLLNLYRNGQDSNGWHSDNEKELGVDPIIASVSFGEERFFHFKHKANNSLKQKILLQHGSLLVMREKTQKFWLHQIPKTKRIIKPRVNLTFRIIR